MEDRHWSEVVFESQNALVEIHSQDKVLNPFSSIVMDFYADGVLVKRVETIFKCSHLEGCDFSWTEDNTKIVLVRGRNKRAINTRYVGVYTWNGIPIPEDRYYESVEVYKNFLACNRESTRFFASFNTLLIEQAQSLYRLVVDNNPHFVLYTARPPEILVRNSLD